MRGVLALLRLSGAIKKKIKVKVYKITYNLIGARCIARGGSWEDNLMDRGELCLLKISEINEQSQSSFVCTYMYLLIKLFLTCVHQNDEYDDKIMLFKKILHQYYHQVKSRETSNIENQIHIRIKSNTAICIIFESAPLSQTMLFIP